jgi:DNA-binding transcriptional LysR family regulator
MDRLTAMQAFVTVAELRGFAAAAKKLRVSPPAVTRLVAALEHRLAIRLLQRTTRSVALTDAGARYLAHARRILDEVDAAERDARAETVAPTGRFVVAAPLAFGRREVAPVVSELLARYPAVTCELALSDRFVDLVDEGVDVAVRIGVLADSSLRVRRVGSTRRIVIASPAYLAAHKRIRTPADLAAHALVQLSAIPEWDVGDARLAIQPRFVTNSAEAAVGHAVRGGGLARVFSYQARDELTSGELVTVLARHEPPPVPIQLVYPASRLPSASLRAFIELVVTTRDWTF